MPAASRAPSASRAAAGASLARTRPDTRCQEGSLRRSSARSAAPAGMTLVPVGAHAPGAKSGGLHRHALVVPERLAENVFRRRRPIVAVYVAFGSSAYGSIAIAFDPIWRRSTSVFTARAPARSSPRRRSISESSGLLKAIDRIAAGEAAAAVGARRRRRHDRERVVGADRAA